MRIINKLWIFFWANFIFPDSVSAATTSCPPAKEYKPYTLNCSTVHSVVEWKIISSDAKIALCNSSSCTPSRPDITNFTRNSTFSTFTILNMSRSSLFYSQEIACIQKENTENSNPILVSSCKLDSVFVRPEKPTCGNPSLSDTSVSLTCQTQKIFPTAGCVFYDKTTGLHGTVTYNNGTLVNQTTDYYRPQCTITLSLGSDIGPGVHQFKVVTYPDVPGGISFGDESDLTSVVNLALPSASLSTSCSSGVNVTENYIKEGSTVMCQCSLDKDGNPPGWVEWFDISNQSVSGTKEKSAVLTVNADPNGPSTDFICRGVSALGHEVSGVSFEKEIASGPTLVNIPDDQDYNHYDLCPPNPSIQLTVYCEVPVTSVNPEPVFSVSINSLSPSEETSVTNTTHYREKSVFTLTTSGRHEITCLAINSMFPTIKKQDTLAIEIRKPPTSEPRIKLVSGNVIHNGETANVVEGDVITCYVEGGYPPANVTLTCESGNDSVTVVQGTMEVSVDISYYKIEINCTCIAIHHVTVCDYNKTSWFTFHNSKEKAKSLNVAAAVGGALAALFVIGLIVLICCILKRNGKLSKCCKSKERNQRRQYPNQERKGGNVSHGSKEYVTQNKIYRSGRNSSEVVVPNEIYGKTSELLTGTPVDTRSESKEISTPNEIYGQGMSSKEVVVPNEIYGKGHAVEKGSQGGFRYTDYTDITPTITSATAVPVNMKKMRSKPEVALKPKPIDKPGQNSAASKDASVLVIETGDVGGAYATVRKPLNSALPHSKAKRADTEMQQIYPDPTWKPEIPDKKFMTDETKLSKEMAGASNDYTNKGFVEDDHDENVYQNQNEPLSRT